MEPYKTKTKSAFGKRGEKRRRYFWKNKNLGSIFAASRRE